MTATVCNSAIVREMAHVLARDAKTHAKPIRVLRLAGYIIRSQLEDAQSAGERIDVAVMP